VFTEARLAEIRRLLDDGKLRDRGVLAERVSSVTVYEQVSAGYDAEAGGGLFAADEPVVAEYLAGREPGVALDAACGTGRFAEFLAKRGHRVIAVLPWPTEACRPTTTSRHPRRIGEGSVRHSGYAK
jgi:SAM-dependent methyltransferase